ncbi:MAG: hypothetical protein JJT81_02380 [Rubellimicrobium sp.]|nr:hypothetical protein [Rubellimicrobium sp.]
MSGLKPGGRTRRRKAGSVLPLTAVLLIGSGLVRLGGEAGQVLAQTGVPLADEQALAEGMCDTSEWPEEMVRAIRGREENVAAAEARLSVRMADLAAIEADLTAQLARLTDAEAALSATLALAETAARDDLARLTQVYENMRPAEAAALFSQMDPAFGAGFVGMMRPDAAAAVMSNLDPSIAYVISVILAGRNALVPNE